MNGAILGMTRNEIQAKLDEIIDFSGCERYIDTPVKRYSSGMTVRLGFAVAAFLDPEILVVDEVLAVGDAEFQKKAIGKMKDVSQGEGRTVLFVSHNMASIRALCNHGVLLEQGEVKYIGDIDSTVDQYLAGTAFSERDIKEAITMCKKGVRIDSIMINGSTSNQVAISAKSSKLHVRIKGHLEKPLKMGLEIRLTDFTEVPIVLYSPHHADSPMMPAGDFLIEETMTLPVGLMGGDFLGSMYLTNSLVEGIVDLPNAFVLSLEGCATPSGFQFNYNARDGFLYLDK